MVMAAVSTTPSRRLPISPVAKMKTSAAMSTTLSSEGEKAAAAKRPMPLSAPDSSETSEIRKR